jgi:hypothetical protein
MGVTVLEAIRFWLLLVVLAVLNGALREKGLIPVLGPTGGLVISGISLSFLIFLVSWLAVPQFGALSASQYWFIGLLWLVMTVLFEFGFGHWIAGKPWNELLAAYNISKGNLWVLVLLVTLISPYVAARVRGYL